MWMCTVLLENDLGLCIKGVLSGFSLPAVFSLKERSLVLFIWCHLFVSFSEVFCEPALSILKYEALNIWIGNLHVHELGSTASLSVMWSPEVSAFRKAARCCSWRQDSSLFPASQIPDPCLLLFCSSSPPSCGFSAELIECWVSLELCKADLWWIISPPVDILSWILDWGPEVSRSEFVVDLVGY